MAWSQGLVGLDLSLSLSYLSNVMGIRELFSGEGTR